MPAPWPMVQIHVDRKGGDSSRSTRSAAVGPSAATHRNTSDLESQSAVARRISGAVTATAVLEVKRKGDADADGGQDGVDMQISVLTFMKIVTALSALYMAVNPWFFLYDADTGDICPYTVLCATSTVEIILLIGSRLSAGALLASLTVSILSKCYATRSFLHHSWIGAVLDFEPSHTAHTYFGLLSLVAALEHGALHCARFIYAKQANLIYETATGRSGVIGCLLLLPIVLPMKTEYLRTKISFQVRKVLHLLYIPLTVALCFHSTTFRYFGSILVVWAILDRAYFTTKQTFLIAHPVFQAVGRGTRVILDLPSGYTFKAGSYIYVNSPMISRSEWHPFSIIQVPGEVSRATFYAEAIRCLARRRYRAWGFIEAMQVGDWTQALFHLGLDQPRLPLWITAAQPSLMEKSIYYDNVVLVCTGAGITPAVSIIERFTKRKNIDLLWMSRDSSMVALFERQLREVKSTVHITGQQTEDTKAALQRLLRSSNKTTSSTQRDAPHPCYCHLHGTVATYDKSFGSIPPFESFASLSPRIMADSTSDTSEDETKIDHRDTEEPDLLPPKNQLFPDARRPSTDSRGQRCFSNSTTMATTGPVTLVFGRPNIGKYLTEAFAMHAERAELPCTDEEINQGLCDTVADGVSLGRCPEEHERLEDMERSRRLDTEQENSKETLMKADAKVVKAVQQQRRGSRVIATHDDTQNKVVANQNNRDNNCTIPTSSGCPLVLYCGANPKVEEAIAKTCDEFGVKWQKEYFGAW